MKRTTTIGGVFGAGVAYELTPSFDIRAEYRGFVGKTPNYGMSDFTTNRYRVISMPVIGRRLSLLACNPQRTKMPRQCSGFFTLPL